MDSVKASRRATKSALFFRVEPEGESVGREEVRVEAARPFLPARLPTSALAIARD
jgi:hypothetical protein